MFKRIFSLVLALAMVLSLTACAKETPAAGQTPTQAVTEAPTQPSAEATEDIPVEVPAAVTGTDEYGPVTYPVTVIDQAGREVTIEKAPERIVSGYYISTSLLIALGQEDKLVGIEAKADKRPIYRLSAPELLELPSVGSAKEFDLEGCAALEPDLVILPQKLKDAAETLTDLGIAVLLVNPENQELSDGMRALLATALDCRDQAENLSLFLYEQYRFLDDMLEGVERPTVYLAGNSSLLSTAGSAMYQHSLIELAGGQNVAADLTDSYWAEVSYEQILTWNPAYIILASDASYSVADVLGDENLAGVDAVINGNVFQLPNDTESWDSPVPGGILGAVWMADVLHEEVVLADVYAAVDYFYRTFYGFSYGEN